MRWIFFVIEIVYLLIFDECLFYGAFDGLGVTKYLWKEYNITQIYFTFIYILCGKDLLIK